MDPRLLAAIALVGGAAFSRSPFGAGKWGPKPVALEQLQSRATFPVRVPAHLPEQFSLERAELLWIPSAAPFAHIPSGQAVCLWYRVGSEGKAAVIQTAAVRGSTPRTREYLSWLMGGGYFFSNMPTGCYLDFPSIHGGAPFGLISMNVSDHDRSTLANALTAQSPAGSSRRARKSRTPE